MSEINHDVKFPQGDGVTVQMFLAAGAKAPHRGSADAAGWDLHANIEQAIMIPSLLSLGQVSPIRRKSNRVMIPTGVFVAIPRGWEGQVRSRSGLANKNGLMVLNTPGTIDADYRGEIKIILANTSERDQWIQPGERIAQLLIKRSPEVVFVGVSSLEELGNTERGAGGFGSTGTTAL